MRKKRISKKRRLAKEKTGGQESESHRLHHEERHVRKELRQVNKELGTEKKKIRFSMIWIVMLLLYGSLILTSYGAYTITTSQEDMTKMINTTDHVEKIIIANKTISDIARRIAETPDTEKYHGVVLESIVPVSYEYFAGDNALIETVIDLREIQDLDIMVMYDMFDSDGNKVYSYGDKVRVTKNNEVLRKSILLTENYAEGEYTIKFQGWFENNGTKYVLPGTTKFLVVERPKEPFIAALGTRGSGMLNISLLLLILLLNIQLLYTAWKTRNE